VLVIVIDLTFSLLVGLSINSLIFSADILPKSIINLLFESFPLSLINLDLASYSGRFFT